MSREVQLIGGPANGKRITVDNGVSSVVVPVFDRSKALPQGDVFISAELCPLTGIAWPRLPISSAMYRETADGRFEHQEAGE